MKTISLMSPNLFNRLIEAEEDSQVDDTEYSLWLDRGANYSPAVKLKIKKELPSGVYKINFDNQEGNFIFTPANVSTDEIYRFSESISDQILKEVDDFWEREEIYKKYNFTHKRGLLLEGPAGNSKTSTINLLIKQLLERKGLIFLVNSLKEFQVLYEALPTIVRKIEPTRPIITIIEDIDQIIAANSGNDSEILDLLDGKQAINHHLVIMTSNNTSDLSEALLRPSRIDMRFVLEVPSKQVRKEYLEKKGIPEDKLEEYATKTEGMSFAQLKEVFISTMILGKDIDKTIDKITNPLESKDYLSKSSNKVKIGI